MNNNEILQNIRTTFSYDDEKMKAIFSSVTLTVTDEQLLAWSKRWGDPLYTELKDAQLASFLNGFIIEKRGKKDGPLPEAENKLSNNKVLTKLKIALDLKAEDVLDVMHQGGSDINKLDLAAFFRKPGNKHYRKCANPVLGQFLAGMALKFKA